MEKYKKNSLAFSLIEISVVLLISSILFLLVYTSSKLIKLSKLSKAINITSKAKFIENDSLVLWLETSILSKTKKNNEVLNNWQDLSKNLIFFDVFGKPIFKNSKYFQGLKAIYFDGSSYLYSDIPLNLSSYTAFLVVKPESGNNTNIYETGIVAKVSDLSNSKIVILKNDGDTKFAKISNKNKFSNIANSDLLNNRPSKFYLGNGFKGEIFEIIIFDKVLGDNEILEIEDYLYNKYMR